MPLANVPTAGDSVSLSLRLNAEWQGRGGVVGAGPSVTSKQGGAGSLDHQ